MARASRRALLVLFPYFVQVLSAVPVIAVAGDYIHSSLARYPEKIAVKHRHRFEAVWERRDRGYCIAGFISENAKEGSLTLDNLSIYLRRRSIMS